MADETLDAVVVGGGSKGLVTALYLQSYGGMKVGVFERMNELGGSWCSIEGLAPGFIADVHASTMADWYFLPLYHDFPRFEDYGGKLFAYPACLGIIFHEKPDDCLILYPYWADPSGEKSAREIARYSEADAETFLKLDDAHFREGLKQATVEAIYNLPPPPDEPDPVERWLADYMKRPGAVIDPQIQRMSMVQAGRALFESMEVRCLGASVPPRVDAGGGMKPWGGTLWWIFQGRRETMRVVGGTHNIAHAVIRLFVENGGKFWSNSEVDKVVIEGEEAKGIRLVDGTEVRAKIVVTNVDPYQLVFRLVGKEHFPRKIVMKINSLEREETCIDWYTFAVHELPHYTAAARNPDINVTQAVHVGVLDDAQMAKEACLRYAGQEVERPQIRVFPTGSEIGIDPTRSPEGKGTLLVETMSLAVPFRSEREWLKHKTYRARYMIDELHTVAPNITWDSVIGITSSSPYDHAMRHLNMPTGNELTIDPMPATKGKFRPIPEFARHRILGIKNLYGTGGGWGNRPSACCSQGYKCYKAIADDFGLRKPWEETGRPF